MEHNKNKLKTKYKFTLPSIGEIIISGFSEAGYKTGYLIEPFNIYLDAGVECDIPANLICLSHGHLDHINALYSILIGSNKCPVMLDNSMLTSTQLMLNSFSSLNSGKNMVYGNWVPIVSNKYDYIYSRNQKFSINTYELNHRVKCRAYGIMMLKDKLKQEYIGLHGIKELKEKVDIMEIIEYPLVLFVNDTDFSGIQNLPFSKYKIVIMECTFFHDDHYIEAIERKHLHWNDVKNIVTINKDTTFILGHFSSRYKKEDMELYNENILKVYNNIILLNI